MSQRNSTYARRADEDYGTPAWVAGPVMTYLRHAGARVLWEPAPDDGKLARALEAGGFPVAPTRDDFLTWPEPPGQVDAIVTNPPYGEKGRNELACAFIRHALTMPVRVVAMLLRVDFDSAKTRVDLFRDNPRFAAKIVLLDRIVWIEPEEGRAAPSENHAWFIWEGRRNAPRIAYGWKE